MPDSPQADVTRLLVAWGRGESRALDALMPLVYEELHRIARAQLVRERAGHTLQPTALVSEAYLRLVDQTRASFRDRTHFFAVCAQLMRRLLIDHARRRLAEKRGGGQQTIALDEEIAWPDRREVDLLDLDAALEELARFDERQSRIVELRFFGGLGVPETAEAMNLSTATVKREWRLARAWLLRRLGEAGDVG